MIQKSKLSVSILDVEFAKDFQYFITIQFGDQKKSTDESAIAQNPIFTKNTVIFDLKTKNTLQGHLIFVANILLQDFEPIHSQQITNKNTKILGQCSLDLTPFGLQPTQTYNLPIKQQMKFVRSKQNREISVGRFITSVKIVMEDDVQNYMENLQICKINKHEYFNDLPDYDEDCNFDWRVKVQIRQCLNLMDNQGINPQVYVELGWTEYKETFPQSQRIFTSNTINNIHPEWNQTFLIVNPLHIRQVKGYIMIAVKQNQQMADIFRIYLPVQSMGKFKPYNLKVTNSLEQNSPQFYFSIILEAPFNNKDSIYDIVVSDIIFQPLKTPFTSIYLAMMSNTQNQPKLNFYSFNPNDDSIQRVLQFQQTEQFNYNLSQSMRIPPIKSSKQYRAATMLTISEFLLKRKLSLYLIGKTNRTSYVIGGICSNIQKDIIKLLIQKSKKKLFLIVKPHPNIKMGQCQIQLCCKQKLENQQMMRNSSVIGQQTATQRLKQDLNISSNESLYKHVHQNNQIISRILKELDDKSQSLRQAASEISDLRTKVKILQNQNCILRKNAAKEEYQVVNLTQRQIQNLNKDEIKNKILQLTLLYKSERSKNKQLDKAIKVMEPQVSNTMQLNSIIAAQKNSIQTLNEKFMKYTKEHDRINVYKDTIKKQQKVITKLEKLLKNGMQEIRIARKNQIELQELKKNSTNYSIPKTNGSQRQEIQNLQKIIAQLQNRQKKGLSKSKQQQGNYEMQFKLHQAQTRISTLEQELQEKSKSYARDLAVLRMKIAQKQAILDGFSL